MRSTKRWHGLFRLRLFFLGLVCVFLPPATTQAKTPERTISRLVSPGVVEEQAPSRAEPTQACLSLPPADEDRAPPVPESWLRGRLKLYLWCHALLR
ncbi:MAG: hypothetical protein AB1938_28525 [Myxococcota bacterium]